MVSSTLQNPPQESKFVPSFLSSVTPPAPFPPPPPPTSSSLASSSLSPSFSLQAVLVTKKSHSDSLLLPSGTSGDKEDGIEPSLSIPKAMASPSLPPPPPPPSPRSPPSSPSSPSSSSVAYSPCIPSTSLSSSKLTTHSSVSVIKRPHRRQNLQQTCQLCRVHFNSNQQKLDHLRGKKHRLVLERLERRKRARHHDDGLRSTHQNPSVPLSTTSSCSSNPTTTATAFQKNSQQPKAMEHDHTVGQAADSTVCSLTEAVPAPSPSFPLFHPTASTSLQTDSSPLRKTWRKEKAYLFVDHSNMLLAGLHTRAEKRKAVPLNGDTKVASTTINSNGDKMSSNCDRESDFVVDVRKLVLLMERGLRQRGCKLDTKFVGGSFRPSEWGHSLTQVNGRASGGTPGSPAAYWHDWQSLGYSVHFLERAGSHDGSREVGVDDMLHANIMASLLGGAVDSKRDPVSASRTLRTLVLVSGDGNLNHGRTTFPGTVEMALQLGWRVELWSWQHALSSRYKLLAARYPGRLEGGPGLVVRFLDAYFDWLTHELPKAPPLPLVLPTVSGMRRMRESSQMPRLCAQHEEADTGGGPRAGGARLAN